MSIPSPANTLNSGSYCRDKQCCKQDQRSGVRVLVLVADDEPDHGLKNAGSLSALIMVSTMSAAPWSSRSSRSSHILRRLARIGAFSDGSRSIRVRAMQKAMPSLPILGCSMEGLLMAAPFPDLSL